MNCNDAAGGKFNNLRSAIGPCGKWVVGFGHDNLQAFVARPGHGIGGKAQLLAGWLGFVRGDDYDDRMTTITMAGLMAR